MIVFVISFAVFALALAGLGLGRFAGREGIRGSCGGLNEAGRCSGCGRAASDSQEPPCRRRRHP